METRLQLRDILDFDCDAAIVTVFEDAAPSLTPEVDSWLREIVASGEFKGKLFDSALLYRPGGMLARRLLVIGCGKRDKFPHTELRKVAGAALRILKQKGARHIAMLLQEPLNEPDDVAAAVEGAIIGDFEPDAYKTNEDKNEKRVDLFSVVVPGGSGALDAAFDRGRIVAESQNFTRSLVNEPGNRLTPTLLAERARAMAAEQGLDCEVLEQDRMTQLGMGSLLGVAQGSAQPPALIILRYRPAQANDSVHLGLVGKGVTFDTGGISIKPSDGMEKMKYDMAGAAAVIGAMRAIAQLKPAMPVTAIAPAVENMPGSRAQRPGDIVKSLSGKTIEVLNTDAEGRLILADAITYAKRLGCTHLVDAATLTGAIVVALAHVYVGVFANHDEFCARLMASAAAEGEKMWRMPIDEDYKEYLKSAFADVPNVGPRWGGSVTAAMFIKEFVEDTPWVHLDIAGTAWNDEAKPFLSKGPSGVGVRTLVHLASNW